MALLDASYFDDLMIGHLTDPSYCHDKYIGVGVSSYSPGLGEIAGDEGGDDTAHVKEGDFDVVWGERAYVEVEKEGQDVELEERDADICESHGDDGRDDL